jgi:glycosyltransferase involved in cell wall biosynthesis
MALSSNNIMANKKLNILYHHRTQGRGAEGVHITSIVKAMEDQGHTVKVLSPHGIDPMKNAGNAPVDKSEVKTSGIDSIWKFISKNLPNFLFEFAEIVYNIPALRHLEKELSSKKYDLIYERYAFYLFSGAMKAKKYNIPFVLEANEVSGIKDRARKQSFPKLCGLFERYIFKRCKSIHTVSSYLKNMIINQNVHESVVHIAPNAIDPEKFTGIKDTGGLTDKYDLKDKLVIGFAGWFDDWDRLDLLVDVFAELKKKHSHLVLLLVGDGEVLNGVRTKLDQYGLTDDAILTGAVTRAEVHNYLSLLDIAVITHSNEFGSPVVMFEFMGLKIPIVAPKLLPITDVLKNDETAKIFEILDMQELTQMLESLIVNEDLRNNIAEAAYTKLMSDHTWKSNAEDIVTTSGALK